jgi:hypothetical protein
MGRAALPKHPDASQKSPPRHSGNSDMHYARQAFLKTNQANPEDEFFRKLI